MSIIVYYLIFFFKTNLSYNESFKVSFPYWNCVSWTFSYLLIAFFIKAFKISDINLKY